MERGWLNKPLSAAGRESASPGSAPLTFDPLSSPFFSHRAACPWSEAWRKRFKVECSCHWQGIFLRLVLTLASEDRYNRLALRGLRAHGRSIGLVAQTPARVSLLNVAEQRGVTMTEPASAEAAADLPKTIGNHEILSRLASGPMGDLLMAKAGDEGRHVIKKPTAPYVKVSKDAIKMLNASFDPRLRPYLEIDHDNKRDRYLVMDYFEVRSASLSALDGLTKGESVAWLISACGALAALHKNKVVHGNLKSSNILVRRSKDRSIPGTVAGALPILSDIGLRYAYDKEYFDALPICGHLPLYGPRSDRYVRGIRPGRRLAARALRRCLLVRRGLHRDLFRISTLRSPR